jgi:nucleotide-binding universal stress UspA family protein
MIAFESVLVPVDFSEPSRKAVTYGLTLARQFSAELILAHIIPESSALTYAFPTETWKIEKEQYERATAEIQSLVPYDQSGALKLRTIVKIGHIEEELLGIVANERVGLMVLGTHGRRFLGRWFIGSVTEHMLRRVPVPVLTVSHIEPEKHQIGLIQLQRILYATDLSESSEAGLRFAIDLSCAAGAQLTVMHAVDDLDRMLWGPAVIARLSGERAKLVDELRKRLDEMIAKARPAGMNIEALVVEGRPFQQIVQVAETSNIDMIVLNLQSKSMLDRALIGSTAERVVRLARVPVLSVPVSAGI